jgi:hypothetical protein
LSNSFERVYFKPDFHPIRKKSVFNSDHLGCQSRVLESIVQRSSALLFAVASQFAPLYYEAAAMTG